MGLKFKLCKVEFGSFTVVHPYTENIIELMKKMGVKFEILRDLTDEESERYLKFEKELFSAWVESLEEE